MMWIYDDPPDSPYEKKMYSILVKLLHDKSVAHKGARNLSLFKFLTAHKYESPTELRKNILLKKGKPFFSRSDAQAVWAFFNETKGGGLEDTSGSAYDALVDRWLKFWFALTPEFIKDPINMVSPFMYPLQTLELIPVYGDTLALAVDVVAQLNKNAAKMAQQYTPLIMGFAPIPEASTVGIVVGYMISTMFIFFNMIIFTTRHHFGEAFKQSLALIPFAGMALENAADSGDGLLGRYGKARLKIIDQLNESGIFAWLGWLITWMTVDPFYQGDPEQDAEWIKSQAGKQFESAKVLGTDLYSTVQNPEKRAQTMEMLKQRARELKEKARQGVDQVKNSELVKSLKNKTSQSISSVKGLLTPKVPQQMNMAPTSSTPLRLNKAKSYGTGKGLSKIRRHKGKWRTQKRSRM